MQDTDRTVIRVGSRKSDLALLQTNIAINSLKQAHPHLRFEVITISTTGDKILDVALSKIGDKSLFTKELEIALLNEQVDFVVHSLKDVPTSCPDKLVLGCVFDRVSPEDVVLMAPSYRGFTLSTLPPGSIVGTSSLRRTATLSRQFPTLKFVSIRGNLNTRLSKLDRIRNQDSSTQTQSEHATASTDLFYDAIILAKAGVERLGWSDRIDEVLDKNYHAVGQGALACECRQDDSFILNLLQSIHDEKAALGCIAERSLMRHLDGGCSTPIGVRSLFEPCSTTFPTSQTLEANILSLDGCQIVQDSFTIDLPQSLPLSNNCNGSSQDRALKLASNCQDASIHTGTNGLRNHENTIPVPSQADLHIANDPNSIFMGILVTPTTPLNRLRMLKAQNLGRDLANRLLDVHNGRALLEQIRSQSTATH